MRQERLAAQPRRRQELFDHDAGQPRDPLLAEKAQPTELERPLDHAGDLGVGLRPLLGPQLQGAGADEGLGVGQAFGLDLGLPEDLLGLAQVALRLRVGQTGLHLDQGRNGDEGVRTHGEGGPVAVHLEVEAEQPRALQVAGLAAGVAGHRREHLVGHQQLASGPVPEQVVRELVRNDRAQLRLRQRRADRALQHQMRLARHVAQRRVHRRRALRLVERDRNLEPEPPPHSAHQRVELGVVGRVEAVAGLQELQTRGGGVLLEKGAGREPGPLLGLVRLQVRDEIAVEGEGLEDRGERGRVGRGSLRRWIVAHAAVPSP